MATPVIESYTTAVTASNVTSLAINKPTGVQSGDLLLIFATNEGATTSPEFTNNLSGWTLLQNYGSDLPDTHSAIYWRIADGSEGSSFTVTSLTSTERLMWCFRISGIDTTTPINDEAGGERGSLNTYAIPTDGTTTGLTTTVADCLLLGIVSYDGADGGTFGVSGTGWSKHASGDLAGTSGSGTSLQACVVQNAQASSGAMSVVTVSCSVNDGWSCAFVAVAPLAGGGTPSGDASSSWGFSSSTTRSSVRTTTASRSWGFSSSTTRTTIRANTASRSWGFSQSATGSQPGATPSGDASISFGFSTSITGKSIRSSGITNTWGFSTTITRKTIRVSGINRSWGFSTNANGSLPSEGNISIGDTISSVLKVGDTSVAALYVGDTQIL